MEETQQRLKDSAEACIKAYEIWGASKKNAEARERLQEAVHELRKVAARLEIEMASSERDEMTQRPIAVPPHRASRPRNAEIGNELPDFITDGRQEPSDEADDGQQPSSNQGQSQSRPRQHSGGRRSFSGQGRRPAGGGSAGHGNTQPE
ncbi:MAG TPA: hypothetical protein DCM27_05015 [Rhodospirillaceae bacterium]|nr:hypothetical protein [Rhodospirillaceae bacterium]